MIASIVGSVGLMTIKKALEATDKTHQEVSHNLANLDTPGYVSKVTDFKGQLLDSKDGSEVAHGKPFEAYMDEAGARRPGVDVEGELGRLAQSSMEQSALVRLLSDRYAEIRMAITEGKR